MDDKEHRGRHIALHKSLDELVADYIGETGNLPSQHTIFELMEWSYEQTTRDFSKGL